MQRLRPILGVTVLLLAAAASGLVSLAQVLQLGSGYRHADILADYEQQRLNDLRPWLRPFTAVNYVDDSPPCRDHFSHASFVTQYVLCPAIIVIDGPPQPCVLLDGRVDVEPRIDLERRLVLDHDAGNGVRLYRAEER